MNNSLQETMFSYFDERIAACDRQKEWLLNDERADEAVFETIRSNVYGIFKAMLKAAIKRSSSDDAEAIKRFFLLKIEEIPVSWKESYRKAEQYGDAEKMQIETIKLETVEEIEATFQRIWEGRQ